MDSNRRAQDTLNPASVSPQEATDPIWDVYRKREHFFVHEWLAPPGIVGRIVGRLGRRAGDFLEGSIARASVHGDPIVYDTAWFPWVAEVEADWQKVRSEVDQIMTFHEHIPAFQDILKQMLHMQSDRKWKTFYLASKGMNCRENAKRCPETMKLLSKIPGMLCAFFSILSPGKHIPPHRGAYNGFLRLHLALRVPEPRDKVRIRIGNRICHWQEGRCLIFDDTFNHEVWNDTDGYRVVLFVDFARPLKRPFHRLHRALLNVGYSLPDEANQNQLRWEERFYGKNR